MPPNLAEPADATIRTILTTIRAIAVVGASANPQRPSFEVMRVLGRHGYRVFAVNPGLAPDAIPGIPVVPTLQALPEAVDMVDVFRNSEAVAGVVDDVLAMPVLPQVLWLQLGVRDDTASARAQAAGLQVVTNRCPAIEIPRLGLDR